MLMPDIQIYIFMDCVQNKYFVSQTHIELLACYIDALTKLCSPKIYTLKP